MNIFVKVWFVYWIWLTRCWVSKGAVFPSISLFLKLFNIWIIHFRFWRPLRSPFVTSNSRVVTSFSFEVNVVTCYLFTSGTEVLHEVTMRCQNPVVSRVSFELQSCWKHDVTSVTWRATWRDAVTADATEIWQPTVVMHDLKSCITQCCVRFVSLSCVNRVWRHSSRIGGTNRRWHNFLPCELRSIVSHTWNVYKTSTLKLSRYEWKCCAVDATVITCTGVRLARIHRSTLLCFLLFCQFPC